MFIVITFNIAKWQNNNKPQIPENLPCAKLPRAPNCSVSNSCSFLSCALAHFLVMRPCLASTFVFRQIYLIHRICEDSRECPCTVISLLHTNQSKEKAGIAHWKLPFPEIRIRHSYLPVCSLSLRGIKWERGSRKEEGAERRETKKRETGEKIRHGRKLLLVIAFWKLWPPFSPSLFSLWYFLFSVFKLKINKNRSPMSPLLQLCL